MAVARKAAEAQTEIVPLQSCDLAVTDTPWAWAEDNAAAVKRFWNKALVDKPALFNGQVMVMGKHSLNGGCLSGEIHKTDYASFLYCKDKGLPAEAGIRNVFGCAVVRSSEGHLLFGRMAPYTATSGRVYPMAGTPDPEDIKDGKLDIEGSMQRELLEEAGLSTSDATRQPGYMLIEDAGMSAVCAVFDFDVPSRELKARMMSYIDLQDQPELDEIVIFRRAGFHVHHRMPGFARTLVQHLLD
ncbi:hypothetical protein [Anderseniella sp. Alg231-50]|uniref:hypothetical protein n=1 Tax=Anderseniella sp. Alg231-50 TaxID=1922226 RepID=UPI000D5626CD